MKEEASLVAWYACCCCWQVLGSCYKPINKSHILKYVNSAVFTLKALDSKCKMC